jgi:SAM-dependent methyltransferase
MLGSLKLFSIFSVNVYLKQLQKWEAPDGVLVESGDLVKRLVAFVSKNGRFPDSVDLRANRLPSATVHVFGSRERTRSTMFLQIGSYVFNFYRFTVENLINRCLKPGARLLDAGCGQGDSLRDYSKPANAEVYGVDLLRSDVVAAKRRWPGSGFIVADLSKLPFVEGTFDGVLSVDVLEHVKNKCSVIGELARVVKKAGFFIGSSTNLLNPVLLMDVAFPSVSGLLIAKFSYMNDPVSRHSRFGPSGLARTLSEKSFRLDTFAMLGAPLFEGKKLPFLVSVWVLFDKLTKRVPLIFLKETMVWQAIRL